MHCMRRPRSPKKRTKINQADLLRSDRIRIFPAQSPTNRKYNPSIRGVVLITICGRRFEKAVKAMTYQEKNRINLKAIVDEV